MADTQAKKLLGGAWASGIAADREDPSDVGIARTEGWNIPYEQIGSGKEPERTVFNQLLRELTGWAIDNMRFGGLHPYDPEINYHQYARCRIGESKFVALIANGPAHGNAESPVMAGQTVWRRY